MNPRPDSHKFDPSRTPPVDITVHARTLNTMMSMDAILDPPEAPDEIGRLGHYRLLRRLGEGGMGLVYLADDAPMDRLVAIKMLRLQEAENDMARARFLREAKVMAQIRNEYVVSIFHIGQQGPVPFMVMEYVPGISLSDLMSYDLATTPKQILRLAMQLTDGLGAAHDQGLVHRDIKPANIMIAAPGCTVKLTDFGLARARHDTRLTQAGTIVGTPAYMAPEQARGSEVDARCDLFSVGCVLYQLCTTVQAFRGQTTMEILLALATQTPIPIRAFNPALPERLETLIARLLEKDPNLRPNSCHEVLAELKEIDAALTGPTPPLPTC